MLMSLLHYVKDPINDNMTDKWIDYFVSNLVVDSSSSSSSSSASSSSSNWRKPVDDKTLQPLPFWFAQPTDANLQKADNIDDHV